MLAASVFMVLAVLSTWIVDVSGQSVPDTEIYKSYSESLKSGLVPYRDFDVEYPPGAILVFAIPALAGSTEPAYYWAFEAMMAAFGGIGVLITAASLSRLRRSPDVTRAILALLALSPVLFGGFALTRFDLVPATLVAVATFLLLSGRERAAALTLGVATAVKVYPLVLVPVAATWIWRQRDRREALLSCGLAVGVVVLTYLPFVLLAPEGVASSIWRQLSRPLQVESLGAATLLVLHHVAGLEVVIEPSYGSQNVTGSHAAVIGAGLSAASIATLCWLWITYARRGVAPEQLVRCCAAVLLALVTFGKVGSPQFLLWLLFPLALVGGRRGVAAGACFAAAVVATGIWYPWLYADLVDDQDPVVSALVLLRGLALLGALVVVVWPDRRAQGAWERSRA